MHKSKAAQQAPAIYSPLITSPSTPRITPATLPGNNPIAPSFVLSTTPKTTSSYLGI
jgi:hypothetical protein